MTVEKISHCIISDAGEWGEFFIREQCLPRISHEGQPCYTQYNATWVCHSSFGTYGHYWHHMGVPFAEFVQDVEQDYLLGKISRRVASPDVAIQSVRLAILRARRVNRCTKRQARDAWDAVEEIETDACDPASIPALLYESSDISHVPIEWCDLETQAYPIQDVQFTKKIWPLFVAALKEGKVKSVDRI